jgi:hypothetical protein
MKISFLLLLISSTAFPQSSARFTITRSVIAGGGTTFSSSARFQLGSTIAQPLAAVPSSARFSIQGGFWIRPAPIFFAPTAVNGSFMVSIQSEPGENYIVSYANSLSSPSWQTLTNITGNDLQDRFAWRVMLRSVAWFLLALGYGICIGHYWIH